MARFTAEWNTADCINKTLVSVFLKSTYLLVSPAGFYSKVAFGQAIGRIATMPRWAVLFIVPCILASCSQQEYSGYQYRPYFVRGVRYTPMSPGQVPGYVEEGIASHYKEGWLFLPGPTSLGEKQWPWSRAGAHKLLPLPCRVRVTNLRNGRSTIIRLNDRGPFIAGRTLDVTEPVAKELGFYEAGLAPVRIEVLSVGDAQWRVSRSPIPGAIPPTTAPSRPRG
jgi:rare lipoprotein A